MPGNQRPGSDVRDGALGDPRDMAKAGLPESQSPGDESSHPPERHLEPVPALRCPVEIGSSQPSGPGAMPSEGIEGDEWDAYVTLARTTRTNVGSPFGRESYGDGGLIVVAGVTTGQGGRESRPHGRRRPGDSDMRGTGRYAQCRTPKRCLMSCVSAAGAAGRLNDCIDKCSTRSCICWPTAASTPTRGR
jgi:hypothetical protein